MNTELRSTNIGELGKYKAVLKPDYSHGELECCYESTPSKQLGIICISKQEKNRSFVLYREEREALLKLNCRWVCFSANIARGFPAIPCLKIQCFSHHLFSWRCSSHPFHTLHCYSNNAKPFLIFPKYYIHPYVSTLQAWRLLLPKPQNSQGKWQCFLVFASFVPCPTKGCSLCVVIAMRHSTAP